MARISLYDSNTSHVTINHSVVIYNRYINGHSNTSHVTINLEIMLINYRYHFIQIHLMLLLINECSGMTG